jgi:hypothetical protein
VRRAQAPARVVRGATRAANMADYYEGEGGGCFGPSSTVLVLLPSTGAWQRTAVSAVSKGDIVATRSLRDGGLGCALVRCVARIARHPGQAPLVQLHGGLTITARHRESLALSAMHPCAQPRLPPRESPHLTAPFATSLTWCTINRLGNSDPGGRRVVPPGGATVCPPCEFEHSRLCLQLCAGALARSTGQRYGMCDVGSWDVWPCHWSRLLGLSSCDRAMPLRAAWLE